MSQKRCYGCMKLKTRTPVCEHCGHSERNRNKPHQLPEGTVLRSQYLVGKTLGQGGFGITYLGWDQYLDTPVAIKEYFPSDMVTRDSTRSTSVINTGTYPPEIYQNFRSRFLREAKTLARLSKVPEIVRVISFFEENNTAYIIMDFVEGVDLLQYTREHGGRLTSEQTLKIMQPVMRAMSVVHREGFVHRDISPDNIMVMKDGSARLLDFGAVRYVDSNAPEQSSTQVILKHGFAPPEQYEARGNLGPWTDEYALCATVYYCLTGRVPPDAPKRLLENTHPQWQSISGLTKQQAQALEKGMALRYKERFSTVTELQEALHAGSVSDDSRDDGPEDIGPTIPVNNRCLSCMKIKRSVGRCEHCGFDGKENDVDELALNTLLNKRYLVGRKVEQTHFEVYYQGWDLKQNKAVLIREFFCKSIVYRNHKAGPGIMGFIRVPNEKEPFQRIFDRNKKEYVEDISLRDFNFTGTIPYRHTFYENGTAYIIMENTGTPLQEYLRHRRLGLEETLALLRPVMDGLDQIHKAGYVYQFVGSENILVDSQGRALLLDKPFVGDFAYKNALYWVEDWADRPVPQNIPPELMATSKEREYYGPWTDTFGVCRVIGECLRGNMPGWVRTALDRGTSRDIRSRYRSMDELECALRQPWSGKTLSPRSFRG